MPFHSLHMLLLLPDTLAALSLSYLGAREIDSTVAFVSRQFHELTLNPEMWFMLCCDTGKTVLTPTPQSPLAYRSHYLANPHIPLDAPSLRLALTMVSSSSLDTPTIIIAGGETLLESNLVISTDCNIVVHPPTARARVVAHTSFSSTANVPLVTIAPKTIVNVQNLSFLHSSPGEDIWNGNCAIFIASGSLFMTSCSVQSSSGRGVVCVKEGVVVARSCIVHDSAATGVYSGGRSVCTLDGCNIMRNGIGGRDIPSGHSGVYIEASKAIIQDCYVGSNR